MTWKFYVVHVNSCTAWRLEAYMKTSSLLIIKEEWKWCWGCLQQYSWMVKQSMLNKSLFVLLQQGAPCFLDVYILLFNTVEFCYSCYGLCSTELVNVSSIVACNKHISVCMNYSQLLCKLRLLLSSSWYDLQEEYCVEYKEDKIQYALVSFQNSYDGSFC